MSDRIRVSRSELEHLRDVVDQHASGRDASAADRLAAELDRAVIVEVLPPDVVTPGSSVRFEEEGTGAVRRATLVYPNEADAGAGRISVLAPIGAALLGLTPGDRIRWPLPGGREARLRILAVEPAVDPAGTAA